MIVSQYNFCIFGLISINATSIFVFRISHHLFSQLQHAQSLKNTPDHLLEVQSKNVAAFDKTFNVRYPVLALTAHSFFHHTYHFNLSYGINFFCIILRPFK
jgi:hypothetical protein